ncbi:hypothetical protein [Oscillatoria sp. FACHB-1406]|uniref:hypothetical protein n=1 Tax=Oscillatoria sp. FACHB-1406 TaxID=2692846 RepID=UPI001686C39F|nr:hypothetical protein [Oscillatoria sp. FACHB-1406]MBD2576381.1 hypothetical protein [Oscillatoria sp. FACHB-1406]
MMSEGAPERPDTLSKADALKSLRETIQQLDRVARRLESATIDALPPTTAFTRLAEDLEALETDLAPIAPALRAADVAKTAVAPPPKRGFFAKLRSFLPASLNEKLSNGALAGILAGLVAAVIAFIAVLIPDSPPKTVAVAPAPNKVEAPVTVTPSPNVIEVPVTVAPSPSLETPVTVNPSPSVVEVPVTVVPSPSVVEVPVTVVPLPSVSEPAKDSPASEVPTAAEEPVAPIDTPSEVATPIPAEIAAQPEEPIVVEAPPEPVLTPEQRLIAAIKTQVAQITSQYADGLIQSIQADFIGSRLAVSLKDEWYDLSASRQDRVAQEMWTRSQELDFSKLELTDSEGHLVARSPVVGQEMAIFLRQRLGIDR